MENSTIKYDFLFVDFDGTLIETITGKTFPEGVWDLRLRFDVLDAIKKYCPKKVYIVTNQGGIRLGYVDQDNFISKIEYVTACVSEYCGVETDYMFCSSNVESDSDRKPNTGMLNYFSDRDKLYWEDCMMIGDASGKAGQFSDSDKKTAENFGIEYEDVDDFIESVKSLE